jgi:hypothetical protein
MVYACEHCSHHWFVNYHGVETPDLRDAEIARLREALEEALETDGGVDYHSDDDSVGSRACCGTLSFKPHESECWVPKARKALEPQK